MKIKFMIIILLAAWLLPGCTIHFKASDFELDAESAVSKGLSYDLESIDILDFWTNENRSTAEIAKIY